jgi:hypothetical protein
MSVYPDEHIFVDSANRRYAAKTGRLRRIQVKVDCFGQVRYSEIKAPA